MIQLEEAQLLFLKLFVLPRSRLSKRNAATPITWKSIDRNNHLLKHNLYIFLKYIRLLRLFI